MTDTNPYQKPEQYPGNAAPQQPLQYPTDVYAPNTYQAQSRPTNVFAIVALIMAFVFPIGGIVFGHIALGQIKRTGEEGHGLALAGTIIGYSLTILAILAIVAYIVFIVFIVAVSAHSADYSYST